MINYIKKHSKLIVLIITTLIVIATTTVVKAGYDSQSNEPSKFDDYTTGRFSSESEDKMYTIEDVIFNKIPFLDPNVFSEEPGGEPLKEGSINEFLRNTIASWYVSLRNIVGAVIIILGIYNGMRMAISTIADEKAKYKEMLYSWIKSIIILAFIHILVMVVLQMNSWIVNRFAKEMTSTEEASIYYIIKSRAYDMRFSIGMPAMCMYIVLVYYYFKFLWRYVKRFFKVLVLLVIAPILAGRAAFDAPKGKGFDVAFKDWLFDFTKTVFIQTVHCVEYIIFVRLAYKIITDNAGGFLYAIIILQFMLKSEEIITNIFNFGDKIDRFGGMRSGFREDFRKFNDMIGLSVGYHAVKNGVGSFKATTKKWDDKLNDKIDSINERIKKKKGSDTLLDRARNKSDRFKQRMYRAQVDNEYLALNRLSADERKDLSGLLTGLQKGGLTPETLSSSQKALLLKAGIDPSTLATRDKLKDLIAQRKSQQRFSRARLRTNAELGAGAFRYGYSRTSRTIKGFMMKSNALNRRYLGHQNTLILKDMALGEGKQAKLAKETLKLHKAARKAAYKSRRQIVVKTVKNTFAGGAGLVAAVPIGAVVPPLGIAVAALSAKKVASSKNMFTAKNGAEDAYTKSYGALGTVAEGKGQMDAILNALNGLNSQKEKDDAVNTMDKIAKFNINTSSISSMVSRYVNANKLGEYDEVAISRGISEITQDIIDNAGTDLSVSDRENIERAVEKTMRQSVSLYGSGQKIQQKDIVENMQKNIIENTVSENNRGFAYMINELSEIKQQGTEKFGVKKNNISDSIKELKKAVKPSDTKSSSDDKKTSSRYADNSDSTKPGDEGKKKSKYNENEDSSSNSSRYADTDDSDNSEPTFTEENNNSSSSDGKKESRYADTGTVDETSNTNSKSNRYNNKDDASDEEAENDSSVEDSEEDDE